MYIIAQERKVSYMATKKQPEDQTPPTCACGCGELVNWRPGKGWATYCKGHFNRGKPGTRLGKTNSPEHRQRMSEGLRKRWAGKRRRDLEETPGPAVYASYEFREARKKLVDGKPCIRCGATENIHAHHQIPGDDSSLIPVCKTCHPTEHATPGAKGQKPPPGEQPPLCACGCGQPVKWKRVRGWATYRKGHGNAKVPAISKLEDPPLCACGCGEPVKFTNGKGWNTYKRGHGQRVYGHYSTRKKAQCP